MAKINTFEAVFHSSYRLCVESGKIYVFAYQKDGEKVSFLNLGNSFDKKVVQNYINNMVKITNHNNYFTIKNGEVGFLKLQKNQIVQNDTIECVKNYINYKKYYDKSEKELQKYQVNSHLLGDISPNEFSKMIKKIENRKEIYDKFLELRNPKPNLINFDFLQNFEESVNKNLDEKKLPKNLIETQETYFSNEGNSLNENINPEEIFTDIELKIPFNYFEGVENDDLDYNSDKIEENKEKVYPEFEIFSSTKTVDTNIDENNNIINDYDKYSTDSSRNELYQNTDVYCEDNSCFI